MRWLVYKHTSPSGKVYIGITHLTPAQRWIRGNGYKKSPIFFNAILKYGWDNIEHKVLIDNLTKEQANEVEQQLIKYYKGIGKSYNITNGGEGTVGYKHTDSYKEGMRLLQLGKPKSKESIDKRKETFSKFPYKCSEETKRKISSAMKGIPHPKATEAAKHANSIAVKLVKRGGYIQTFTSKRDLAKFYKISEWKVSTYSKSHKYLSEVDGYITEAKLKE